MYVAILIINPCLSKEIDMSTIWHRDTHKRIKGKGFSPEVLSISAMSAQIDPSLIQGFLQSEIEGSYISYALLTVLIYDTGKTSAPLLSM